MESRKQNGQSLIEYLIIVALIAIGGLGIMRTLGATIHTRMANIANALQGHTTNLNNPQVTSDQYQKRDLSDFFKDAGSDDSSSQGSH